MTTQSEILRLSDSRDSMRNTLVNWGVALSTDKLDILATKLNLIENQGAIEAEVKEGDSYTIPRGYHNGSGVVKGISGGGNYTLQQKTVTPTKAAQPITSDAGFYGLSSVTVNPIPAAYQDVSATTASAETVLATKVFTAADGTTTAGTMPNIGVQTGTLSATKTSQTISKGYHDGTGSINIVLENKEATPTEDDQTITPTAGKVLNSVTVKAITSKYGNVNDTSLADASKILIGTTVLMRNSSNEATYVDGSMKNNGAVDLTMDGLTKTSVTIPTGYHSGAGKVSLTDDIERALAAI